MPRLFSGKIILYLLALHVLDLCLTSGLGIFRPIFLYLWVLYTAFYMPMSALLPMAMMAGILRDLTGSLPLGVETLSLAAAASVLSFLMLKIQVEFFLTRFVLSGLFVFISALLGFIFSAFLSSNAQLTWHAFSSIFCSALVSALVMPVFFEISRKWFPPETSSLKQYELFG